MRISPELRTAIAGLALITNLALIPIGALATANAALAPTHGKRHTPTVTAHPPRVPSLSISVADGRTAARPGDRLAYRVSVTNSGGAGARYLKVTLTLPPEVRLMSASGHGAARAGKVTWRAPGLAAGHAATFSVLGVLRPTPPGLIRLAAVACAVARVSGPVVCAAHLDRLPAAPRQPPRAGGATTGTRSHTGMPTWFVAVGLAVLTCAVLAALAEYLVRLRRRPPRSV